MSVIPMAVPSNNTKQQPFGGLFIFLLIVFIVLSGIDDSQACPVPVVECVCQRGQIYCDGLDYRSIPEFTQNNKTYDTLNLGRNRLKRIRGKAFKNLSVKRIKIKYNLVPMDVNKKAFRGLEDVLEVLHITKSQVQTLPPGVFRHMKKLRHVNLSGNRIYKLPMGVFQGASSIQTLDLMDNRMSHLGNAVFDGLDNLKVLYLGNNKISFIDSEAFKGLANLQELILSTNDIRDLQPRSFEHLIHLVRLDLGNNKIPALFPLMFKGMEKLEELSLNDNPLIMIGEAVFSSMNKLRVLYLGDGRLRYLKANMFKGLDNLEILHLDNNYISYFQDGVFTYLPNLKRLQVISNRLTTINPCAFRDIKQVKEIRAIRNPMVCTCQLQWSSLTTMPVIAGRCVAPSKRRGHQVRSKSNYDGCPSQEDIVTQCRKGTDGRLATAKIPKEDNKTIMKKFGKEPPDMRDNRDKVEGKKSLMSKLRKRAKKNKRDRS